MRTWHAIDRYFTYSQSESEMAECIDITGDKFSKMLYIFPHFIDIDWVLSKEFNVYPQHEFTYHVRIFCFYVFIVIDDNSTSRKYHYLITTFIDNLSVCGQSNVFMTQKNLRRNRMYVDRPKCC